MPHMAGTDRSSRHSIPNCFDRRRFVVAGCEERFFAADEEFLKKPNMRVSFVMRARANQMFRVVTEGYARRRPGVMRSRKNFRKFLRRPPSRPRRKRELHPLPAQPALRSSEI